MRRALALAAPPRGLGRPIPTAPLSLVGARSAAASPFRRPVPPSSVSQSRFKAGDSQSGFETRDSQFIETKDSQFIETRDSQFELETGDSPPRPKLTVKPRDWWSKLEAEAFKTRIEIKGRWSRHHPSCRQAEPESMRVVERVQEPKSRPEPQPDTPTYLFSDLVLDLGAEGAPGVRLYDNTDEELWTHKWNAPSESDAAARKRLDNQIRAANNARNVWQYLQGNGLFRYWRIRETDMLSLALRGSPTLDEKLAGQYPPPVDKVSQDTANLLHRNGIPQVAWGDDATILWWMESRKDEKPLRGWRGPDHNHQKFACCHGRFDYGEFRRILTFALATGKGFASPTSDLQKQIYKMCHDGPDKPAELNSCYNVLSFITDFERALRLGGDRLNTQLCLTAIEHAAGGIYTRAAQHYLFLLQSMLDTEPGLKPLAAVGVRRALDRLSLALDSATARRGSGAELHIRPTVFELLTGYSMNTVECLDASFFRIVMAKEVRKTSLQTFIDLLARLGGLRTLAQLWRDKTLRWHGQPNGPGSREALIFTRALVKARNAVLTYDLGTPLLIDDLGAAVRMDCQAMPTDVTNVGLPAPDAAAEEFPSELPSLVERALEMDTVDQAVKEIKRLIAGPNEELHSRRFLPQAVEEEGVSLGSRRASSSRIGVRYKARSESASDLGHAGEE